MSKLLDLAKAMSGEKSLSGAFGRWILAVSGVGDQVPGISTTVDSLVSLIQLVTGGGLLPATGTTNGARPLSGYSTALLQTGDEVFVQGVNEIYI